MEQVAERIAKSGIQCRTCSENIVLKTKADPRNEDRFKFLKPASFQYVHGHAHNYDPDDVYFFASSESPATEAEMLTNRANYELLG
jgi:hypothetical protein